MKMPKINFEPLLNYSEDSLLKKVWDNPLARCFLVYLRCKYAHQTEWEYLKDILVKEGYISGYEVVGRTEGRPDLQGTIKITLKYVGKNQKVITGLKKISKPGLRVYANSDNIPSVLNGMGIAILSTSKGVITDKEAKELHVGGEVLAYIW